MHGVIEDKMGWVILYVQHVSNTQIMYISPTTCVPPVYSITAVVGRYFDYLMQSKILGAASRAEVLWLEGLSKRLLLQITRRK